MSTEDESFEENGLFVTEDGEEATGHFYAYAHLAGKDFTLMGRYNFVGGHLSAPMSDAQKMARILCRYYPIKLSKLSPDEFKAALAAKKAETK